MSLHSLPAVKELTDLGALDIRAEIDGYSLTLLNVQGVARETTRALLSRIPEEARQLTEAGMVIRYAQPADVTELIPLDHESDQGMATVAYPRRRHVTDRQIQEGQRNRRRRGA